MAPKRLVLFHRDCDGFGAAFACHCAFRKSAPGRLDAYTGPPPETPVGVVEGRPLRSLAHAVYLDTTTYIGVQYNEPLPEKAKTEAWDEIYIVDFSYPLETLLALAQDCPKVVVIDHHRTAEGALREFNKEMIFRRDCGQNNQSRAVYFERNSGAVLTWSYLTGMATFMAPPDLLQYIQDRDLWKWELPNSREVNLYIASLPWDFAVWDRFDLNTAVAAGSAIAAYEDQIIEARVGAAQLMNFSPEFLHNHPEHRAAFYFGECAIGDYTIPVVNCTACVSEVGNALCKAYPEAPFSMTYCDRPDGLRSYSLRSIGDFDVSVIAKAFGGGGHKNASGFSLPSPNII